MDTSTYDVTSADSHAIVNENRCLLMSVVPDSLLGVVFLVFD